MRVGPVLPRIVVARGAAAGLVIRWAGVARAAGPGVRVSERPARASFLVAGRAVASAVLGRPRVTGFALWICGVSDVEALGAGTLPGVLGVLGLVTGAAVGADGVREDELCACRVADGTVLAAIDVLRCVALRALRGRHVVAARTGDGDVAGEVGFAAVDHCGLGRVEGGLGECVVDAGFL
jgi:hypothetical protein